MKRIPNLMSEVYGIIPDDLKITYIFKHTCDISDLLGKTITEITLPPENEDQDVILIECSDGSAYVMYHEQDCCETVEIDDVNGDLDWLIGSPLTLAEEVTSSSGDENADTAKDEWDDSYTWTFYHLATVKGYVDIRWYGASNGYYSEDVTVSKIREESGCEIQKG